MSTVSRRVVYVLLAAVLVLLAGMAALLGVAYDRHQRLEDATIDLKRNLAQQEHKIIELEERLLQCDTLQPAPIDSSWNMKPAPIHSADRAIGQSSLPDW